MRRAWPKSSWPFWVTANAALHWFTGFETRGSYSPLGEMALLHCWRITYFLLECEGPFTNSFIPSLYLNKTKLWEVTYIETYKCLQKCIELPIFLSNFKLLHSPSNVWCPFWICFWFKEIPSVPQSSLAFKFFSSESLAC